MLMRNFKISSDERAAWGRLRRQEPYVYICMRTHVRRGRIACARHGMWNQSATVRERRCIYIACGRKIRSWEFEIFLTLVHSRVCCLLAVWIFRFERAAPLVWRLLIDISVRQSCARASCSMVYERRGMNCYIGIYMTYETVANGKC